MSKERKERINRYVARNMQIARKRRKISQTAMAKHLSVSTSAYGEWESQNKTSSPSPADLYLFCEATGASILDILPEFGGMW